MLSYGEKGDNSQIHAEIESLFANFPFAKGDTPPTLLEQTYEFSFQQGFVSWKGRTQKQQPPTL